MAEKRLTERVAAPVLSLLIGLGIGVAAESHTDTIAAEKVRTVQVCEDIHPIEPKVTEAFHDCITKGVPNGTKIGGNKIKVGQSAAYVDSYVAAQQSEQGLEADRLIYWSLGGLALGLSDWVI